MSTEENEFVSTNTYVSSSNDGYQVVFVGECTFLGAIVKNNAGSARYFQIFDSTTVPADGALPAITALNVASGAQVSLKLTELGGKVCGKGLAFCSSSTEATKTVAGSDLLVTIWYVVNQ